MILVFLGWYANSSATVTDNKSNTYTLISNTRYYGNGTTLAAYYATNVAAGTTVVTAAFASSVEYPWMISTEYPITNSAPFR